MSVKVSIYMTTRVPLELGGRDNVDILKLVKTSTRFTAFYIFIYKQEIPTRLIKMEPQMVSECSLTPSESSLSIQHTILLTKLSLKQIN